jgi:hypothetical protein
MIVNNDKLKKLIDYVTTECYYCPLSCSGGLNSCGKHDDESCEAIILEWLQEFDIAEALEAGAHIVNDQVVFPPISLPDDFTLNVPCDSGESCVSSCPWYDNCPFEDD